MVNELFLDNNLQILSKCFFYFYFFFISDILFLETRFMYHGAVLYLDLIIIKFLKARVFFL